jgi:hypothetical protein
MDAGSQPDVLRSILCEQLPRIMKIHSVAGLLVLSSALWSAETPTPAFPEAKIELPPLSLADAARARMPSGFGSAAVFTPATAAALARAPRKVSHMPVLRPKESDAAMVITPPDNGVDYRLKVKRPDVEQAE